MPILTKRSHYLGSADRARSSDDTHEAALYSILPSPTGAFELSQVEEVDEDEYDSDGSAIEDEDTPDPKAMPFSAAQTGKSPNAQGKSLK